jgi:hypothetical protein
LVAENTEQNLVNKEMTMKKMEEDSSSRTF